MEMVATDSARNRPSTQVTFGQPLYRRTLFKLKSEKAVAARHRKIICGGNESIFPDGVNSYPIKLLASIFGRPFSLLVVPSVSVREGFPH